MATHSSVLAWKIPGTGEPGGLPSLGSQESDTTEATQQQHLIYIWVEYSHYCCLNQLSSLLFRFSAVEAFDSCQFYDSGEKLYFFLLSVHFESLRRVEQKTHQAGCLSQLQRGARGRVREEIFCLPDFTGPISVFCQMGRKPLSDQTDTHYYYNFRPKYSLERTDQLAKDIPKHEAVVLASSCQWLLSFPPSPSTPSPEQRAPLHKGGDCVPAAAVTGAFILICSPSLNSPLRFRNKQCNLRHQRHPAGSGFQK